MRLFLEPNQATFAVARLQQDESFWASTSALLSLEGRLQPEETHPHASLTRIVARESMGEITLAPALPGVVRSLTLSEERLWVQSVSLLGASTSLQISAPKTRGESFLSVEGSGELLLSGFGALWEIDLSSDDSVSLENIVAFDDSLSYTLHRLGGLAARLFSAGPVVCQFQNSGSIFVQARSPREFGERFHRTAAA
jgi:uncharacterized protein (AIM24 family)